MPTQTATELELQVLAPTGLADDDIATQPASDDDADADTDDKLDLDEEDEDEDEDEDDDDDEDAA